MPETGAALEVLHPGLLTTVQDAGRRARAQGFPAAGAADPVAFRLAGALVGNPRGEAALEVTLRGPRLRVHAPAVVALCGAPFAATLDGRPFPLWRAVAVRPGQVLDVGTAPRGLRAVLAVRGGLDVPSVAGSASTDLRGGFGGHGGRALRAGDILSGHAVRLGVPPAGVVAPAGRTSVGPAHVLRVLPTAEATPELLRALPGRAFQVTPQADRMGVRLAGQLPAAANPGRLSLPTVPGAVQLPPDGQPILLLPDAGTHGGYPVPLVVAGVDVPRLGQLRPGDRVGFQVVTLEAAQAALGAQERLLRGVEQALAWHWRTGGPGVRD